jgi:serine protease AprX
MRTTRSLTILFLTGTLWAQNPKIHPDLANAAPRETVRVIVQYRDAPNQSKQERVRVLGGTIHQELELVRAHAVSLPASQLEWLATDPDVKAIVPDYRVSASLDTAAPAVNASAAWTAHQIGSGIGVAVIDSGVSPHNDLGGRIVYNQDFTGEGQNADLYGHGTHVAGIIAGDGTRSEGESYFKTFKGMAPGVNIISLRALNSQGAGTDSTVIAAIQKAISLKSQYNIRVINLSLGRPVSGSYVSDPLCQAVESAWKSGIVVVVSAGNYGRTNNSGVDGYGTITAPGNDPYVITVGAMKTMGTPGRSDDLIASYSSKGPTLYDHIVKPDLVAPGNQVHSLLGNGMPYLFPTYTTTQLLCSYYQFFCGTGMSHDYYVLNGTSMAAPMVTGAAAIIIGAHPTLTPDQVKARLMKTAYKSFPASSTVIANGNAYTAYYDVFTVGAGYLDIQAALNSTDVATGNALSPSLLYNSSTDTGTLKYATGSAFQASGLFGSSLVWGTAQLVNGSSIVWGTSDTWSTSIVWGTAGPNAFSIVWGTGTNGSVNPTSIVWGTSFQTGAIDPLTAILTNGE